MLSRISVIGRLADSPEVKTVTTPAGNSQVLNLRIAVNDKLAGVDSEGRAVPSFFQTAIWGDTAKSISQYVNKGDLIAVEGHLSVSLFQDKDGFVHPRLEIKRGQITLLPNPKREPQAGGSLKGKLPQEALASVQEAPAPTVQNAPTPVQELPW